DATDVLARPVVPKGLLALGGLLSSPGFAIESLLPATDVSQAMGAPVTVLAAPVPGPLASTRYVLGDGKSVVLTVVAISGTLADRAWDRAVRQAGRRRMQQPS